MKEIPLVFVYGVLAVAGGVARYLNAYATGAAFSFRIFIASMFVSGFSGYMFALVGTSMALPSPILFMMAGAGGFFGDQSMKLVMEYVTKKT